MYRNGSKPSQGDVLQALSTAFMTNRISRRRFMQIAVAAGVTTTAAKALAEELGDAAITQAYNSKNLRKEYDYIVVGGGSSGSVVAGRLAEETDAEVLLIEAGGTDQLEAVLHPLTWFVKNVRSERDWGYSAEPTDEVNGRALMLPMGKVIGGGSSINAMIWARGHKADFDFWAAETGVDAWNYENTLKTYLRIEDFGGPEDPKRRGKGGRVYMEPARDASELALRFLDGCAEVGIPVYEDQNGEMMEGDGGAALANLIVKDNVRCNMPRAYLWDNLSRPNLTVLTGVFAHKLLMDGTRATGILLEKDGELHEITAASRVVMTAGAINTPKMLMLSGIGRSQDLQPLGIEMVQDLQGVGQNFQDHILAAGCNWEYFDDHVVAPRNNGGEGTFFWKTDSSLDRPNLQPFTISYPYYTEVTGEQFEVSPNGWALAPGIVSPKSRGEVRLLGADPATAEVAIDAAFLREQQDLDDLVACIDLCREIGNSQAMSSLAKRELAPMEMQTRSQKEEFAKNSAWTYFHESCTCKMGRDDMSVVDGDLNVYGIENLSICDASTMPRVSTGNTMAPTVVIAERMVNLLLGKA